MGLNKVKKAVVFIHPEEYTDFITGLKMLSIVELIPQEQEKQELKFLWFTDSEIKLYLNKLEFILDNVKRYTGTERFVYNHPSWNIKEISVEERKFIDENYNLIVEIDKEIKHKKTEIQNLISNITVLNHYKGLNINLDILFKMKSVTGYFCKSIFKSGAKFIEKIKDEKLVFCPWENKDKNNLYFLILVHNSVRERFLELAEKYDIEIQDIRKICSSSFIEEEIKKNKEKITNEENEIKKLQNKIKKVFSSVKDKILNLHIYFLEFNDLITAEKNVPEIKNIKMLTCWVPEKFIPKFKKFSDKFSNVSVLFFEPKEDEDVPVVLENSSVVEPYEFITTLYGYPKKNTVDPTEFLAPFFTLFFALCVSDVIYGVLMLISWFLLKDKISPESEYRKLVQLFKYLGIATVISGFFLNSFLGFKLIDKIFSLERIILLDPLNRPVDMLKFAFMLGWIHIIFGMIIKTGYSIKVKDYWTMVDSLSWGLFITFFAPVGYKFLFPKDINEELYRISLYISGIIFLIIVITQSRNIKSIFLKPLTIFVKLYSVIGYCADILSYSRILALALSGAAIAQTMNLLTKRLLSASLLGLTFIEPVIAPVIFLLGHIFNFLMSCLAGIVHSARLQYLEFFSKFFVGGGRPIKIFSPVKVVE